MALTIDRSGTSAARAAIQSRNEIRCRAVRTGWPLTSIAGSSGQRSTRTVQISATDVPPAIQLALLVNWIGFTLLFAYFLARRVEIARLEDAGP